MPKPEEVIEDFQAVRLLINVYMIKKAKRPNTPVSQKYFIQEVRKEYSSRGYAYPKKTIIYTWKHLLEKYQYFKQKFTEKQARKNWLYFDLMDECFDESKSTAYKKFTDPKWMSLLIKSLGKYGPAVFQQELTMDVLEKLEEEFRQAQNYEVNQKDIYAQWLLLKDFYNRNKKNGRYKKLKFLNHACFTELKNLFEADKDPQQLTCKDVETKRLKKIDHPTVPTPTIEPLTPFTTIMHDILLQYLKRNKEKIQNREIILEGAREEFRKLGYNVTKEIICNEWNDLVDLQELLETNKSVDRWSCYADVNHIYNARSRCPSIVDDDDNQSTIGSIIVENLRKNQSLKQADYAKLTEKLLNVYESNSMEFLEIKEILLERNLLREETNYLLQMVVEKMQKKTSLS